MMTMAHHLTFQDKVLIVLSNLNPVMLAGRTFEAAIGGEDLKSNRDKQALVNIADKLVCQMVSKVFLGGFHLHTLRKLNLLIHWPRCPKFFI